MKFKFSIILSTLALALSVGAGVSFLNNKKSAASVEASVGNYSRSQSTYYTSAFTHKVTSSQYGSTLLSTLHELMYDTHQSFNTYDDLWTYIKDTDYDIDNPDNIILLYSRQSIDGTATASSWNREHVWCKSLSGGLYTSVSGTTTGAGSDLHHLRPASTAYNSSRGNTPYGVVSNYGTRMGDTDCYSDGSNFEPADYIKGDVARVLMYTYMHYSSEVGGTSTKTGALSITNIVNKNSNQAAWDLLMDWNESDPVDYQEMIRNNKCAQLLGNYNPFIDHPEFARMIWDDSSSYQAGLFFQTSYKTVNVGSNYTNTASAWGNVSSSGDVVYTSDNPAVASVNSSTGQVTGVANGVARIKARATINGVSKISYHFVKVGSGYTPKYTLNASGIVYTPTSNSTAVASEQISSETVTFSNTYNTTKSHTQITGGKKITLTINNFPKTISSMILYMHSNASSGKGSISVTVGGSTYRTISDSTFASMNGGSYSESYVPIDVTNSSASKKTGTIVITINCSTSSLFFQKAVIDYSERTVTKATSISVTPSTIQMTPGEDNYLTTSFIPSSTTLQTCTWTSSNTSFATVNKYGLVRAIAVGTATITATASDGSGATGTTTINVVSEVTPEPSGTVTGVTVAPSSTSLDVYNNTTRTLSATVSGTGSFSQSVSWSVYSASPSGCATVDSSGTVTAVAQGSAVIRATSAQDSTYYGSCTVTISDSTPELSSIAVATAPTKTTYTAGEYFDPTGLVIRRYFSNSTNDTYAYLNHEGSFTFNPTTSTALTTSHVSVSISYNGKSTAQAITVNEASAEPEEFSGTYNYSNKGTTWSLSDCSDQSSYWLCPDSGTESIALIEGIFTDKTITSAIVITINSGTYGSGTNPSASTFAMYNSSECTSQVSATQTGTLPTSKTYTDVIYTISQANAANFSDDLAIKITKPGKQIRLVSITVEFDYETSSSTPTPTVDSVTVSPSTLTLNIYSGAVSETLTATVTASGGAAQTVSWSISPTNGNVTVTNGVVNAASNATVGEYTVTATSTVDGSKSDSCTVTVVNQAPSVTSVTWSAPTINVFSGTTLTSSDTSSWNVRYDLDNGQTDQIPVSYNIKLGGTTITLPYTWTVSDDGKTLGVEYGGVSSSTTTVTVTQTINTVTMESEGETSTSDLTFTSSCGGSGTADDGKTWTITSDAAESNYDSTKGVHYGTGKLAVEYIQLTSNSFTNGTITQIKVNASGASGVSGSVSVTVGGNSFGEVQSFNSTASEKTFTGTASAGAIVVRIYKASAAVNAIYCKSVKVTYTTTGSSVTISNSTDHIEAQRLAVLFAKTFNDFMAETEYCTTGLSAAWASCSTAYTLFKESAASLGETEEAWCFDLIKYATAQYSDDSGEACIERMMKTYEICVTKHGQTAFMDDIVTLESNSYNPLVLVNSKSANKVIIISVISLISLSIVGGYFFIHRRKEN